METKPEISQSDLSKVKNNLLNKEQLNFLFAETPKAHIYERPAKGGGKWQYVTGTYFKKVLNLMFGWNWDFEVIDHEVSIEFKQVIIKGRLTVRTGGQSITKMQFGRQDIKFKVYYKTDDTGTPIKDARGYKIKDFAKTDQKATPLDLGNDLKAATTDALKKCASEFGIAGDIYAPNEFKSITIIEDAEPRSLKELTAMILNAEDIDELQLLFEGLTADEKIIATDAVNAKKAEL